MQLSPGAMKDYIHKLSEEGSKIEDYITDVALYSDGVITLNEMMGMPMNKIKAFEKRLSDKLKREAGKSGTEYL